MAPRKSLRDNATQKSTTEEQEQGTGSCSIGNPEQEPVPVAYEKKAARRDRFPSPASCSSDSAAKRAGYSPRTADRNGPRCLSVRYLWHPVFGPDLTRNKAPLNQGQLISLFAASQLSASGLSRRVGLDFLHIPATLTSSKNK